MKKTLTILNFDRIYQFQSFYKQTNYRWVELSDVLGTYCFCREMTLQEIDRRIGEKRTPLTYIGSGNYHYVSYLELRKVQQPFTLVLFDFHSDLLPSPDPGMISCGSWVLWALTRLPQLKKVIIIGLNEQSALHLPIKLKKKVRTFTLPEIHRDPQFIQRLNQEIITPLIYISIDKDVLSRQDADTNWDQGEMRLYELIELLNGLISHYRVAGVDVCGEPSIRDEEILRDEMKKICERNSIANEAILKCVFQHIDHIRAS